MSLKLALSSAILVGSLHLAIATPVVDWVTTNGDAGFENGTAETNSPVTTDSDAETIVGSFPEVTLLVGHSLTLTGSIVITGRTGIIPGNQIRWGFFDAPGIPATGAGSNYVGVWAAASNGPAEIRSADGSTTNPFSGTASTMISSASSENGGATRFGETLTFSLTITRIDDTQISTTATLENGVDFSTTWPATNSPASPASFTYDCVGILLGGTTDATKATFANVEATLDTGEDPDETIIAEITIDPETGDGTISWNSKPGTFYSVDASSDLITFPINIEDNVSANSNETFVIIEDIFGTLGSHSFFRVTEKPTINN